MAPIEDNNLIKNQETTMDVFFPVNGNTGGPMGWSYGMEDWPNPFEAAFRKYGSRFGESVKFANPCFLMANRYRPRPPPDRKAGGIRRRTNSKPPVTPLTDAAKRRGYKAAAAAVEAAAAARWRERNGTAGAATLLTPPSSADDVDDVDDVNNPPSPTVKTASIPIKTTIVLTRLPPEIDFFDYIREESVSHLPLGKWFRGWSQELQVRAQLEQMHWLLMHG
ncbi:hypothetical protein VTN77DRAFT_9619 [Rasamsonia byssochlamydoides]|uniref:uncharacterized protein n=1 Tax=Rasamsonia byssochlamydoides TaxID=89139 RepID=UPI0037420637